jgi:F-type H+-transporting ATPase subunit b
VISLNITFIFQLVNFLLLMMLLNVLLYRPIRKILADRAAEIAGGHEKAAEVDRDVQEKMALYETRLREAKAKASEERGVMKKDALAEESAVLDKARKEATDSMNLLKGQVAKEAASAREFLREQTRSLSLEICEKVLGRRL